MSEIPPSSSPEEKLIKAIFSHGTADGAPLEVAILERDREEAVNAGKSQAVEFIDRKIKEIKATFPEAFEAKEGTP
jgi:hypothetical protein